MNNQQPQGQKIGNINIKTEDLKPVNCSCGNPYFYQAMEIKRLSAIISPDGKEKFVPMPALLCTKCHSPLKEQG